MADPVEPPSPLFWLNKEEMTEGRKVDWASKIEPGPLLSSRSGSTTGISFVLPTCGPSSNIVNIYKASFFLYLQKG